MLSILVLALLVCCGETASAPGLLRVVDDAGDTVALRAPARRIVSLIPASTELLFAIGAGAAVVARTTWCDYPPAALDVPEVGDGIRPNLEAILGQQPDLVLLYNSVQNAAARERLRSAGIAVVRLTTDRLDDLGRIVRLLGRLTGQTAPADSLVAAFDDALADASVPPTPTPPRVFILAWTQPPMTIGRGSFLSELVERAGGANLFADLPAPSGEVSIEAVVARDPDLILVTDSGIPAFVRRPEWQAVRAVRERRFLGVSGSAFSRPSPRAPEAIRELATRLREAGP